MVFGIFAPSAKFGRDLIRKRNMTEGANEGEGGSTRSCAMAGTVKITGSIGGAVAGGAFIGSAGNGRISSAPRADYAEAAVAVVTGTGHAGKTYELAGDEAYTLSDLAAEISTQTGKQIPYRDLPEADYAAALKGFGLPEGLADAIAGWDVGASKGALFSDSKQLSGLIGRPTTPLSAAVKAALA